MSTAASAYAQNCCEGKTDRRLQTALLQWMWTFIGRVEVLQLSVAETPEIQSVVGDPYAHP